MKHRKHIKRVYEGDYVAEIQVHLLDTDEGWGPYLSLEDAQKLDRLRVALRENDLPTALGLARVYRLTPVQAAG